MNGGEIIMKNKVYIKNIVIFILCIVLFLLLYIPRQLLDWDDSLNFHFIQNIYNGYIPYSEMNMIITPLFHYLGLIFFYVFGEKFLSFFIYGSVIFSTLVLISHIYQKQFINNKRILTVAFLSLIAWCVFVIGPNYNTLFLLFPLLIIYINKKHGISNSLLVLYGILLGLGFLTKQNYGSIFIIFFFIFIFLYSKKNKISFIKNALLTILGGSIVAIPFLIYLLINNNFYDFIDLCFGGMFDFTNNGCVEYILIAALLIVTGTTILLCFKKYKKSTDYHYLLLGLFNIASIFSAVPIMNNYHMYVGMFIPIITLPILINELENNLTYDKAIKFSKAIGYTWGVVTFIFIAFSQPSQLVNLKKYDFENEYTVFNDYGIVDTNFFDMVKNINSFIKEKELEGYNVYVISSDAHIYNIPTRKNNNKFDLITYGNLGYDGINRIIDELKEVQNPMFLKYVLEDDTQEPVEVEEFIVNNYKYVGDIECLRIFVKE